MTPINELYRYCGTRAVNVLRFSSYETVEQVQAASDAELLDIRTVGPGTVAEIREGVRKLFGETPAPHVPRRGSDVEAWIRQRRDRYGVTDGAWQALNDLLYDYREHADTGTPLDQEIQGPHEEES